MSEREKVVLGSNDNTTPTGSHHGRVESTTSK